MQNLIKIIVVIVLLIFGDTQDIFAQKQKILVVPYTRFQFVSEYNLSEIAQINNVTEQEVFNQYTKSLSDAFSSYKNEQFEFEMIAEIDYLSLKKLMKYDIEKFKGKKYNASNLNLVEADKLAELLSQYQAEYILFVNWYNIEKTVHTAYIGDNNKRNSFSLHKIDFDVYNNKKEKIIGKGNVKLNCGEFPSVAMIEEKCLKAHSLTNCYQGLITDLLKELSLNK
ncbi:MAG: hypothetical protein HYU68_03210 [Bacteroidetes bacterium]|nr:hypothetical protein [Bacteroidota bacterium]